VDDAHGPILAVEGYTGPFDLLLRLVERREVDLLTVSLAAVTSQYLAQLSEVRQRNPENLTAFLVVAAKLLLIKSCLLLPARPDAPAPEAAPRDPTDLTARLRLYRQFRRAADWLADQDGADRRTYPRPPWPYRPAAPTPRPPLDSTLLPAAFRAAAARAARVAPSAPLPVERYTVAEALAMLRRALERTEAVRFDDLVTPAAGPERFVATFLAVLELVRQGAAGAEQPERFGPIHLRRSVEPATGKGSKFEEHHRDPEGAETGQVWGGGGGDHS
jgi:segregation and condensation protein A